MLKEDLLKKLVDELLPLPHDVYNYTKVRIMPIRLTEKSVLVTIYNNGNIKDVYIPKSVMRIDTLKEIWIQTWFCDKEDIFI